MEEMYTTISISRIKYLNLVSYFEYSEKFYGKVLVQQFIDTEAECLQYIPEVNKPFQSELINRATYSKPTHSMEKTDVDSTELN